MISYDAAYGYELGHIVRDGIERMYGGTHEDPNVMYYLTLYNEPLVQPAEPENFDVEGALKGIYHLASPTITGPKAQLMASGVAVPWALEAQQILASDWGVAADVWSVTSWSELRREGLAAEEHNFLNPTAEAKVPYLTSPDQVRAFIPGDYATLGADDFGFSDTRAAARRYFKIDSHSLVVRTLQSLVKRGEMDPAVLPQAIEKYSLHDVNAGTTGSAGGES